MTFVTSRARRLLGTMTGSMSDQASRAFRITALGITVVLALSQTAELIAAGGGAISGGIALAVAAAFAFAFWRITGMRPGHATLGIHVLLVLQTMATFTVAVDLLPVVAMELGYMLPARHAWRWLGVMLVLLTIVGVLAIQDGSFQPATGLTHLPFLGQAVATLVQLAGWSLFAFIAGRFLATEREEREEYARLNAELEATRELLAQTSRAGERLRIARELHDTLGHHLTALAVNLDLAARLDGEGAKEVVRRSHMVSKLLLSDVRDTVSTMRQEKPIDLERALRTLADKVPGLQVELVVDPDLNVTGEQAHALLRAAQEGITNAVRHGNARRFSVSLRQDGSRVDLSMADDGTGTGEVKPGNGLLGMRERIARLGGQLDFGRDANGGGFRVHVVLPAEDTPA